MIAFNFQTSLSSKKLKHWEVKLLNFLRHLSKDLFLMQVYTMKIPCAQRYCIPSDKTIHVTLCFTRPSHRGLNRTVWQK